MTSSEPEPTFYDLVGGESTFRALVGRFYAGVAEDPVLRAGLSEPRSRRPRGAAVSFSWSSMGRPAYVFRAARSPTVADCGTRRSSSVNGTPGLAVALRTALDSLELPVEQPIPYGAIWKPPAFSLQNSP